MQLKRVGQISYFTFDSLPRRGVRHAVLTRHGGISLDPYRSLNLSSAVGDERHHVAENRRQAYGAFDRSFETLVHARLVHKAGVAVVTQANHGQVLGEVDGLITQDIGCGLTMNYADCAPIFIYDPVQHAIGLGHAGWGGTVRDIPGAMVDAMVRNFGSRPAQLMASIGPSIGPAVYEVDEPVISAVKAVFPQDASRLLISQPEKERPHFDLPHANRLNFERAGVHQIELSELDTGQNTDLFFSHRMEGGKTGRFGAILILDSKND